MKSFGILRTNPGLTTNVKVVVDSKYGLSLESINSSPELANTKFKKFEFNKENYYDELLPYFYSGLPAEIAYHIKYEDDSDTMSTNFADQFDEIYQYGARNIEDNKNYDEEYEYFAPLYVHRNKMPKNFIIFRVDGPGITSVNRSNFKSEILSKMKTVKLFDMTKSTVLGEWIDLNFDNNEFFPDTPLEMNYQRLEFSRWNGIDYKSGGHVSKSFFMDDVLEKEMEVFEMEKLIFDGYKKNGVVFPNIVNFSFLFDDTPADANTLRKWSINRYYGFYIDDIEKVTSISPYSPPALKSDVVVKANNILETVSGGSPFVDGWSDSSPFYVEYGGEYYKVEKFTEKTTMSVKPISTSIVQKKQNSTSFPSKSGTVQVSQANLVDVNNPLTSNYVSDQKTDTYVDRWRIICDFDLSGKQSMLNKNTAYIDENKYLRAGVYDSNGAYFNIEDFDRADVWLIEVDGTYHNLTLDSTGISVVTDYTFEFGNDFYRYYVNKNDPSYTKTTFFKVDANNAPKKFNIHRLKFTDIKDFDTRIVDTEPSKFEYEKEFELTDTEESKLYLQNLNSQTSPKQFDDFYLSGKVVRIPVSSEYTANNETFKINGGLLSPIWRKNPVYCRWAFEGSLSANDYPYVLNNSSTFEEHNRTTNTFDSDPQRVERNLDYFYTINSSNPAYTHHTLHVQKSDATGIDTKFDFDHNMYMGLGTVISGTGVNKGLDFDYFDNIFRLKSSFNYDKYVKNTKKYSEFIKGDSSTPNYTVFRGIKFSMYDVKNIKLNSAGKIDIVNTVTKNTFEDYKFSVILTGLDNGMQWDIIDKWEMDRSYKQGDLVEHNDMLFRAVRDTVCTTPKLNLICKDDTEYVVRNVKPGPHNLLAYDTNATFPLSDVRFNSIFTYIFGGTPRNIFDVIQTDCRDWELYSGISDKNLGNVLWDPLRAYELKYTTNEIVYNGGNFYVYSNEQGTVDFWNPISAFIEKEVELTGGKIRNGYSVGSVVFFKGSFYSSRINGNLTTPDSTEWTKISDAYSLLKWQPVSLWSPNRQYGVSTHILHDEVLYISTSAVPSGEEPATSALWKRLYSIAPDTEVVYTRNNNPIIRQNGEYYRIINNTVGSTLENGIRIFINHKFKNVLVNIYVNDNTIGNLKNTDRDTLYTSLSKKLTAKNFIDCINNPMLRNGFSDYITYHIIEADGTQTEYRFGRNLTDLKHILFAEGPDLIKVKTNSLTTFEKNETKLKPTKYLTDGNITSPTQIDYYNNTHMAAEIVENVNRENMVSTYYNLHNKFFRFSGNYMPLFYDVELFNTDNSVEHNRIELMLEISSMQNVRFLYGFNGSSYEKSHEISPSGSFSTSLEYHSQILKRISEEFTSVKFNSTILPKTKTSDSGEVLSLTDTSFDEVNGVWYDRSKGEGYATIMAATSSPVYRKTDLYPGNRFDFYGSTTTISMMQTSKIDANDTAMTYEFLVRAGDVSTFNEFMGDNWTTFGFRSGRAFMKNKYENGTESAVYSTSILEPGVWYHLTFTLKYDSVAAKTYKRVFIDGKDMTSAETLSLNYTSAPMVSSKIDYATHKQFVIGSGRDYQSDTPPFAEKLFSGSISSIRFIDRVLTDAEIVSNFVSYHQTLSVKYKSSVGEIKLSLLTDEPKLYLDFYDAFDTGYNFYSIGLGATGGNPPYAYSVNGVAYSPNTVVTAVAKGTSMYIVVTDAIGLTSSTGTYLVNSNTDTPYLLKSPFVY